MCVEKSNMKIPLQNNLLLYLSKSAQRGKSYTRAQMLFKLAKHLMAKSRIGGRVGDA